MSKVLDGKKTANKIHQGIINKLLLYNKKPHLAIVVIGNNTASYTYVKNKIKACNKVGFKCTLIKHEEISQQELIRIINELNADPEVNGIIVQLPLPSYLNKQLIISSINPQKDVDGLHPLNYGNLIYNNHQYIPATPLGIITLLNEYNITTQGKHCVIVGRSTIVGLPLSILMSQREQNATVTICHSYTKELDKITKQADILISATGKPKLITKGMVKEDAIVIDVGINRIPVSDTQTIVTGDVDYQSVSEICSYITPVPGGIGPMTIASLLSNTLKSFEASQRVN